MNKIIQQIKTRVIFLNLSVFEHLAASWDHPPTAQLKFTRKIDGLKADWNFFISSQNGFAVGLIEKKELKIFGRKLWTKKTFSRLL